MYLLSELGGAWSVCHGAAGLLALISETEYMEIIITNHISPRPLSTVVSLLTSEISASTSSHQFTILHAYCRGDPLYSYRWKLHNRVFYSIHKVTFVSASMFSHDFYCDIEMPSPADAEYICHHFLSRGPHQCPRTRHDGYMHERLRAKSRVLTL